MKSIVHQPRFLDSTASFDLAKINGHYSVGDRLYIWKHTALADASQTKQPIKWHFHDDVWKKMNWRQSSGMSLQSLYRLRAEQLRQKYQYLILAWSGGGDSTNILDAFVQNDIHLDEVVIAWAVNASIGRYQPTSGDTSPENFPSEWDFAVKPRIEWLQANRPEIRLTIRDWSDRIALDCDEDSLLKITNSQAYTGVLRSREIDEVVRERSAKNPNVGVILGVNPALITIMNDQYVATHFKDLFGESRSDIMADGTPRQVEYFYWSPDLPEIVLEQAHEVRRFLGSYPQTARYFEQANVGRQGFQMSSIGYENVEPERLLKKILFYPTFDCSVFQAKKHPNRIEPEHYHWLYDHPHSREFTKRFYGVAQSMYRLIDPQFVIDRSGAGCPYKFFQSDYHVVGRIDTLDVPDPVHQNMFQKFTHLLPWYL